MLDPHRSYDLVNKHDSPILDPSTEYWSVQNCFKTHETNHVEWSEPTTYKSIPFSSVLSKIYAKFTAYRQPTKKQQILSVDDSGQIGTTCDVKQ